MRKIGLVITAVILAMFIQGCASKKEIQETPKVQVVEKAKVLSDGKYYSINTSTTSTIGDTINEIASQLLETMKIKPNLESIAVTSFVDLHQLNKTTYFGRVMAESFFNELHSRGLTLADFRGQKSLVLNADGEFFLSRDVKKLSSTVTTKYVLVGTYAKIEEGVIINARIIDNQTGIIVASSRVVHHSTSCEIFENCKKEVKNRKVLRTEPVQVEVTQKRTISLSTDGCSSINCPKNYTSLDCNERNKNSCGIKKDKKSQKKNKTCDYK